MNQPLMTKFSIRYCLYCFALILCILSCETQEELLPEQYQGYTLKRQLVGKEARQFVNKLHLQNVATVENEIGFYESGKGSAAIYISHYVSGKAAEADFEKMIEKISPQNSVFVGGTFLELNGKKVYRCFGMGQTHFVFARNKQLFWLSLETTTAREFLNEYLNFLR